MAMRTTSDPMAVWRRLLGDSQLQDLPFKIETNQHGQLVLSPHNPRHGKRQLQIGELLGKAISSGARAVEFSVATSQGIKVPDVIWMSEERDAQIPEEAPASPVMPELCVEVLSKGNTEEEMTEKRALYFEEGAEEVWVVDEDGQVSFHSAEGVIQHSKIAPDFPSKLPALR